MKVHWSVIFTLNGASNTTFQRVMTGKSIVLRYFYFLVDNLKYLEILAYSVTSRIISGIFALTKKTQRILSNLTNAKQNVFFPKILTTARVAQQYYQTLYAVIVYLLFTTQLEPKTAV